MTDIYCHIHTPINIEEKNKYFIPPIIFEGRLYIIREKILHDVLQKISYLQDYIKFSREDRYENTLKWLSKKNLLNEGFLEGISQYWIEDVFLPQVSNYKAFQKNGKNQPIIPENYLKDIFRIANIYSYIKKQKNRFNEYVENELDIIENELYFINNEKSLKTRQIHYQNGIFELLLNNFNTKIASPVDLKAHEINNINFSCETLLSSNDLFVFKTAGVKDYKFNLTGTSYKECLRENTFVKLFAGLSSGNKDEVYLKYILEEAIMHSQLFTNDLIDFGVGYLKYIIGFEEKIKSNNDKKQLQIAEKAESSSIVLLENSRNTAIETKEHIVSRYDYLKNYTNVYFAPDSEMIKLINVLNMDEQNLKRLNDLIWGRQNQLESELLKFMFNKGNLPYSAYGYASINF